MYIRARAMYFYYKTFYGLLHLICTTACLFYSREALDLVAVVGSHPRTEDVSVTQNEEGKSMIMRNFLRQ